MGPAEAAKRHLIWHGVLLFLLGLLNGAVVHCFSDARVALSAHLDALTSGTFLIVLGLLWQYLRLPARVAVAARWLAVYGMYAIWAGLLLAAATGAIQELPLAGSGHRQAGRAAPWQESLVELLLGSGSFTILFAVVAVLFGLRRLKRTSS